MRHAGVRRPLVHAAGLTFPLHHQQRHRHLHPGLSAQQYVPVFPTIRPYQYAPSFSHDQAIPVCTVFFQQSGHTSMCHLFPHDRAVPVCTVFAHDQAYQYAPSFPHDQAILVCTIFSHDQAIPVCTVFSHDQAIPVCAIFFPMIKPYQYVPSFFP